MSQNPPTTPPTASRPLPRPRRSAPKPAARPRIVPMDILWMVVLAVVLLITEALLHGVSALNGSASWAAAGTVAAVYLLGAQTRDRITGVVAGLLLATSAPFISSAGSALWLVWFTFTTIASLASFAAGIRTLALIFAAIATALHPIALVLGAILLVVTARPNAAKAFPFAGLYVGVGLAAYALRTTVGHANTALMPFTEPQLLAWLITPAMLLVIWFLVPFCVELSETQRRNRWLPALCWTILLGIGESLFHFHEGVSALPFMPLILLFIGAGVARLLPTMLGDIPNPVTRYVLAGVAIISLPLLRAGVESRLPHVTQTTQAPVPTVPSHPVTVPPPVAHVPATPAPVVKPKVIVATPKPVKPAVTPVVKKPTPAASKPPTPVAVQPTPQPTKPKPAPPVAPKPVAKKPTASQPQIITVPHHIVEINKLPTSGGVPEYKWVNGHMVHRSRWAIQWDKTHPKH